MLSSSGGGQDRLQVGVVRRCHVDSVDVRIAEQGTDIAVETGHTVALRWADDLPVVLVYATASGQDALSTAGWTMEEGDSPVLLLAGLGAPAETTTVDDLLQRSEAVAGIVLVEEQAPSAPAQGLQET